MFVFFSQQCRKNKPLDKEDLILAVQRKYGEDVSVNISLPPSVEGLDDEDLAERSFFIFKFCDLLVFSGSGTDKISYRTYLEIQIAKEEALKILFLKKAGREVVLFEEPLLEVLQKGKATKNKWAKVLLP